AAPPGGGDVPSHGILATLPDDQPIRAELYGLEHLEDRARELAGAARLAAPGRPGHPLLRRFKRIGAELEEARRQIAEATRRQEAITPDAEWLLDNYYIIEETLREVRDDLPRGYYQQLPKLAGGPFDGYPRVYALALEP